MQNFTQEQLIKEVMWENHQIEMGVAKYRASLGTKEAFETKGGMRLIQECIPNMVEGLEAAYKEADDILFNKGAGGRSPWAFMIGLVKPEQAAVIVLNRTLAHSQVMKADQHSNGKTPITATSLAKQIANGLRQQLMFENWKENEKAKLKEHNASCVNEDDKYQKSYAQLLIARAKGNVSRPTLAKWKNKLETYTNIEWSDVEKQHIGMKMLHVLVESNPEIFKYQMVTIKGKKTRLIDLTDNAWQTIHMCNDTAEIQSPLLMPTLIEPLDYQYKDGQLVGGYHHIETPLFTQKLNKHTAGDKGASSVRFLEAINNVQKTKWKVNPYTMMVVDTIMGQNIALGDIPKVCNLTAEVLPSEEWDALTKEERAEFCKKQSELKDKILSQRGKHAAFVRKVTVARKMMAAGTFYFPHFADFRGRLYPLPSEFTPQGDSVCKGLLQFAEGKELGTSGLYWLKVHAANTFGKDKETLDNRVQFIDDNMDMLAECTIDPINNTEWTTTEEPLAFLAVAKELTDAYELADPTKFVSKIAVAMDGTCNGMQLLSLLGRDNLGAEKTNCRAIDSRFDLYSEVATYVIAQCKALKGDNVIAAEWYKKLYNNPTAARKTVKRAVMTTPYGVTGRGIRDQLIADKKCNDMDTTKASAADFMKDCILDAMSLVNGKAVEIMGYFQNVAQIMAEDQKPLSWETPMGLRVTQAYNKMHDKRVTTVFGTITLWTEDAALGLDASKQFTSSAPNVIHSFDAAMLQMTVEKLVEKGASDFAMIHDSYGMHAASVEELHATLRACAYEIFSGDVLAEFHEDVQSQTEVQLPTPPTQGDYDMTEILKAPYFFS